MNLAPKESKDLIEDRLNTLKQLFPETFIEGKIDINKMKELLGDAVETKGERYSFTWAGRTQSIRTRDKRSKATLVPSKKESVGFDTTKNVFIEGDNLEVLKILQKSYEGKIKMIYIDPPYNTGNDFVYKDDFTDSLKNYLKQTGQLGENGEKLSTNSETSGRYHSNWLSMMYPRLFLARNLLRDDGVIFVSIDDNEVHNLRMMMNEIFGEENFIAQIVWRRRVSSGLAQKRVSVDHEYVLVYQKQDFSFIGEEKDFSKYDNPDNDPRGPWILDNLTVGMSKDQRPNQNYVLVDPKTGQKFEPNPNRVWAYIPETMDKKIKEGKIYFPDDPKKRPMLKRFQNELKIGLNPISTWASEVSLNAEATREIQDSFGFLAFNYAKPVNLIKHLIKTGTDKDAIILDFFAGSGTTAQAVLEQNLTDGGNRQFILVQLPEKILDNSDAGKSGYKTIADICKERIRKIGNKIKEEQGQKKITETKMDLGFKVFKLSKSNCFVWDSEETKDPNTLVKHLEASAKGASTADKEALAFELMLREGYSLDSELQPVKLGKNDFLKASDEESTLWMCFDDEIENNSVESLHLAKEDKLIVLDSSLTDTQKVNLSRNFRVETI